MPDPQREYTVTVEKYRKALAKAGTSVIAAGDKGKLLKLLDQITTALKVSAQSDKRTEQNNKLVNELIKIAKEFKKFNDDAKKVGKELDEGIKAANTARNLASSQKGFDKSKDFEKMGDDMRNVSSWLDITKPKEMKLTEFVAAVE
jgi:hypothetical protein